MTPKEAIKLQEELLSLLPEVGFNKYVASTRLGIDALKRILDGRDKGYVYFGHLLPGETYEEERDTLKGTGTPS